MNTNNKSIKADQYTDLDTIYAQCSGPGGLKLAEFMADQMGLTPDMRLLDVGANRGYQTCFIAKEYGVDTVAIDPWLDRMDGRPMVEHIQENAIRWNVGSRVLPIRAEVPETGFASGSFDAVYSTTALEMVRCITGEEGYMACLKEIFRVLVPGGVFGLGEPMHLDVPVPEDLLPFVTQPEYPWVEAFRDIHQTAEAVAAAGFEIIKADYAGDAKKWWDEYAVHDPFCKEKPEEDPKTISVDNGRWTSFGYVIARKPTIAPSGVSLGPATMML